MLELHTFLAIMDLLTLAWSRLRDWMWAASWTLTRLFSTVLDLRHTDTGLVVSSILIGVAVGLSNCRVSHRHALV